MTDLPAAFLDGGFDYRTGTLTAEGVPLERIADDVGTPVYAYSAAAITRAYTALSDSLKRRLPSVSLCYAVKANGNLAVIRHLAKLGAGADVVSEGEARLAMAAGIAAADIVFSGVGKTDAELRFAVEAGIGQINIESRGELQRLGPIAAERSTPVRIAVRVNPDIDGQTLPQITTGTPDTKFGIAIDQAPAVFAEATALPGIDPVGVAVHIGSQIGDMSPFRDAYRRVADLVGTLRDGGFDVRVVDLGGGLAIPYEDGVRSDTEAYGDMVAAIVGDLNTHVTIEPGRFLLGNAGVLLTRVIETKRDLARPFLIVDAAMNDLMRPALYGAYHAMAPVHAPDDGQTAEPVDVVGPVCESTDTFTRGRPLPPMAAGEVLAIASAGAYAACLSSTYNGRALVPEVLIDDGRFAVVRKRPIFTDIIRDQQMPDWLETPS